MNPKFKFLALTAFILLGIMGLQAVYISLNYQLSENELLTGVIMLVLALIAEILIFIELIKRTR